MANKYGGLITLTAISILVMRAYTQSSTRRCQNGSETTYHLDVLPGHGWDNLRNVEQLNVFDISFSECRRSLDGLYFIPNHVEILPRMATHFETFSEVFQHYKNYRSLRSNSINVNSGGSYGKLSISGSFSSEHQTVRTQQVNSRSITTRVQLRQHHFTVLAEQSMGLSRGFRDRLLDIGYQIHHNKSLEAAYLSDLLVADYGTHVITRVDTGGILWKLDTVRTNSKSISNEEMTEIKASASVGFGILFNLSVGYGRKSADTNSSGYEKSLTSQQIGAFGGEPVKPGTDAAKWSRSLPKRLVAIDVDGEPIYKVVSPIYLGEKLPLKMIGQINGAVVQAVERYYSANTVIGCMDRASSNFDVSANIPSQDCKLERSPFMLGGFFQKCHGSGELCDGILKKNFITGGYSCPRGYKEIPLLSRTFRVEEPCTGLWFWRSCKKLSATYSISWCAAETRTSSKDSSFLLGGIYTKTSINPMTNDQTCPPEFESISFGNNDINICLSRDFELSSENRVTFGGMFSCNAGNPYTVWSSSPRNKSLDSSDMKFITVKSSLLSSGPAEWPKKCPAGYSQHVGFVDDGCEVMFCSKSGQIKNANNVEHQNVKRPPFVLLPIGVLPKPRVLEPIKLDVGSWVYDNKKSTWEFEERSRLQTAVAALGTLFGTLLLAGVIAAAIMVWKRNQGNQECEPMTGVSTQTPDEEWNEAAAEDAHTTPTFHFSKTEMVSVEILADEV